MYSALKSLNLKPEIFMMDFKEVAMNVEESEFSNFIVPLKNVFFLLITMHLISRRKKQDYKKCM